MKLYSNDENKRLISLMRAKGREPHSIVITGEAGSGRRTLGKYIAAALLCENSGEPCGRCRACKMIESGNHPDFKTIEANDSGNYKLDSIREVVADAVIKPNEGALKVYLIPDLDRSPQTAVAVQNVLLKLVEEPPDHCVIIMTAVTKEIFLPTIISRVLCLSAQPCTRQQAEEWLTLHGGFGQDDIIRAVSCCGGNIGRCVQFLTGKELPAAYECAKAVAEAIASKSEYDTLKAFMAADGKKPVLRLTFEMLSETARAACLTAMGAPREDCCCEKEAQALAEQYNSLQLEELCTLINDYRGRINANCSLSLLVNSFTARALGQ
ncbi:MAG: hypothetical protein IJ561_08045 [Ruminococcus sp.]|nr:hypothetical protein [Ruminococcus sp.]